MYFCALIALSTSHHHSSLLCFELSVTKIKPNKKFPSIAFIDFLFTAAHVLDDESGLSSWRLRYPCFNHHHFLLTTLPDRGRG